MNTIHCGVTQVQLIDWERDLINLINYLIYQSSLINNQMNGEQFAYTILTDDWFP